MIEGLVYDPRTSEWVTVADWIARNRAADRPDLRATQPDAVVGEGGQS